MKHRLERVRELIKRELGTIIQRDVAFSASLVSITSVDITPDLKQAHIFISAIGTESQKRASLAALEAHRVALQHELSKRVILKFTPRLNFKLDESIERGTRVIELMDHLGLSHITPDDEEPDDHGEDEHPV